MTRWKRRYVIIADGCLYYFTNKADVDRAAPRLILPLEGVAVEGVGDSVLRLVRDDDAMGNDGGISVVGSVTSKGHLLRAAKKLSDNSLQARDLRDFTLRATSATERDLWLEAISAQIIALPLRRIIARNGDAIPPPGANPSDILLTPPRTPVREPSSGASALGAATGGIATLRSDVQGSGSAGGTGSTDQLSLLSRPAAMSFGMLNVEHIEGDATGLPLFPADDVSTPPRDAYTASAPPSPRPSTESLSAIVRSLSNRALPPHAERRLPNSSSVHNATIHPPVPGAERSWVSFDSTHAVPPSPQSSVQPSSSPANPPMISPQSRPPTAAKLSPLVAPRLSGSAAVNQSPHSSGTSGSSRQVRALQGLHSAATGLLRSEDGTKARLLRSNRHHPSVGDDSVADTAYSSSSSDSEDGAPDEGPAGSPCIGDDGNDTEIILETKDTSVNDIRFTHAKPTGAVTREESHTWGYRRAVVEKGHSSVLPPPRAADLRARQYSLASSVTGEDDTGDADDEVQAGAGSPSFISSEDAADPTSVIVGRIPGKGVGRTVPTNGATSAMAGQTKRKAVGALGFLRMMSGAGGDSTGHKLLPQASTSPSVTGSVDEGSSSRKQA